MVELYNTSCVMASETISDLVICANEASAGPSSMLGVGILASGFLIAIWFIMVMSLQKKTNIKGSILVSSFVCLLMSIFLKSMNLIGFTLVILFLIVTAISLGLSWTKNIGD